MIADLDLIDRIYEAAFIPQLWPVILEEMSRITGCYGGTLFSIDAHQDIRQIVTELYRDVMHVFVRDGWASRNIRFEKLVDYQYAGFVTDLDIMTQEDVDTHPFYTELIRPHGGGWAIGTHLPCPTGDVLVINLERSYAAGPIENEHCARLDGLRPHLARAGLMAVRLRLEKAKAMVDVLQEIGLPAAVLRRNGTALATNRSFDALGKQIATGAFDKLKLINPSSDALFKRSLDGLNADNNPDVRSIPVPATADQPALIAHLIPIKGAAHDIFSRAVSVFVVTPLHAPTGPSADVLNGLFDLSAAEARVAQAIVAGKTIDTASVEFKLSRETVRKQLQSVFDKTGTSRQAELVGLLARAGLAKPLAQ